MNALVREALEYLCYKILKNLILQKHDQRNESLFGYFWIFSALILCFLLLQYFYTQVWSTVQDKVPKTHKKLPGHKAHLKLKMPQSGVGSMQGSNEDCLLMKGHTRGGDAPTM